MRPLNLSLPQFFFFFFQTALVSLCSYSWNLIKIWNLWTLSKDLSRTLLFTLCHLSKVWKDFVTEKQYSLSVPKWSCCEYWCSGVGVRRLFSDPAYPARTSDVPSRREEQLHCCGPNSDILSRHFRIGLCVECQRLAMPFNSRMNELRTPGPILEHHKVA